MTDSTPIDERIRALSPDKRVLLARRLRDEARAREGPDGNGRVRLVAFVTLSVGEAGAFEPEADELREHLRGELPEHMIPASVRLLDALPLLPNGKVDVAMLENMPGDSEPEADQWVEPRDGTEELLAAIWCDVLQADAVSVHDNFFELGGDSILSVHVVSRANQQGLALSPNDLFNFPTIAQLGERARSRCQEGTGKAGETAAVVAAPTSERRSSNASATGDGGTLSPFVMVHGVAKMVSLIRTHLSAGQNLFTFSAHWERADLGRHATVEDMAEEYVAELRTLQPSGPYYLGGYSMGAPIALEMARLLQRQGEEVGLLFLLDPPGRVRGRTSLTAEDERWRDGEPDSVPAPPRTGGAIVGHLGEIGKRSSGDALRYVIDEAKAQFQYRLLRPLRVRFRNRVLRPTSLAVALLCRKLKLSLPMLFRRSYVRSVYTDAWNRFELKPFNGRVAIFRASKNPFAEDRGLWEDIARGELKVEWFEARHFDFYTDTATMNLWASRLAQLLEDYHAPARPVSSHGPNDEHGASMPTARVARI